VGEDVREGFGELLVFREILEEGFPHGARVDVVGDGNMDERHHEPAAFEEDVDNVSAFNEVKRRQLSVEIHAVPDRDPRIADGIGDAARRSLAVEKDKDPGEEEHDAGKKALEEERAKEEEGENDAKDHVPGGGLFVDDVFRRFPRKERLAAR
jgi:hypothetical protein